MSNAIIAPNVPVTDKILKCPQKSWLALDSEFTVAEVQEKACNDPTNQLDFPHDFPWLRMKNIIMSGAFSGPATFIAPVITLYKEGSRKIHLISGLHGDYPNTMSKDGTFSDRTDEGAYDVDFKTASTLEQRLKGLKIEVHDFSGKTKNLNDGIKQKMKDAVDANEPIILTWCFGVATFLVTEVPQAPPKVKPTPEMPIYPLMIKASKTKIRDYISSHWSWALELQKLPAVKGDPIEI